MHVLDDERLVFKEGFSDVHRVSCQSLGLSLWRAPSMSDDNSFSSVSMRVHSRSFGICPDASDAGLHKGDLAFFVHAGHSSGRNTSFVNASDKRAVAFR